MNTVRTLTERRAAGKAAKRRRLFSEVKALLTGGSLVFTGLLLATVCLLGRVA